MKIKLFVGFLVLASLMIAIPAQAEIQVAVVSPKVEELQSQLKYWQNQLARLQAGETLELPEFISMTGPEKLKVGERGAWWLKAHQLPVGVTIAYQTEWGDQPELWVMRVPGREDGRQVIQSFHTFKKTGTYTQTFTIFAPNLPAVTATTTVRVTN